MAEELKKEDTAVAPSKEKKTASKDAKPKQKKPNKFVGFFKKIGKFFKECRIELKKIVWASPSATLKNTILVTVVILLFAALFFGLDKLFNTMINDWLGSIPTIIANH